MKTKLSQEYLIEVHKRCEAATPGPWWSYVEGRDHWSGDSFIWRGGMDDRVEDMYILGETIADQDFIAHAREDIPLLLNAIIQIIKENSTISTDLINEIRIRCNEATPGPWIIDVEKNKLSSYEKYIKPLGFEKEFQFHDATQADIEFIAHAREDVPNLLDELDRLRGLLNE